MKIRHTQTIIDRFNAIKAQLAELDRAESLDDFIQLWLPEAAETDLLRDTVAECREGLESASELYSAIYDMISQPEIPLEVEEVRIMSLHKSKGLSSPYVFIVGCVEGLMPAKARAGTPQDERDAQLEEDRRLFYVGITRAKSNLPDRAGYLGLSYAQRMPSADAFASQIAPVRVEGRTAILQPSRFLGEMQPHIPDALFNAPL